ncbi:MAG: Rieske 2Fe-2S domain-containing protein [Candidatus Marinimicrobia bacterium]|nr:Rieske 2Fe-2S domain-containing protein [Candidatus Neomarinimicrobiota bacterium]
MAEPTVQWYRVADLDSLPDNRVRTVTAGTHQVCLVHHEGKLTALDNRCPHQGGPLGEGQLEDGWVICPWHAYQYDPITGQGPEGFEDKVDPYPVELREDGIFVGLETAVHRTTLADQVVAVMTSWGVEVVFGMVGHSNLGLADAMRRAELDGKMHYYGIRHEGAGAFAASAYAKLTGRTAVCFAIAGPGATNLITGMWDAHVDNVPMLALVGQVNTQIMGPGTFQEVDLHSALNPVTRWQQVVLGSENASNLVALAIKHAEVEHGPTALIFPDEMQRLPARDPQPDTPRVGRVPLVAIAPPKDELKRALDLINAAKRPTIVCGQGAAAFRDHVLRLAEKLAAPIVTTFKAKGMVPDNHPLACGVLGRSGIPVASIMMGSADLLITFGTSFSVHTGIAEYLPTIQVDRDRMTLGKFHPVEVPLWGDIGVTIEQLLDDEGLAPKPRPQLRAEIAARWKKWRAEKERRRADLSASGLNSASIFHALSNLAPADAIIAVDVGNNTYSFGRYFECQQQTILMSGYLGSIGFGFPAALGAWSAHTGRKVIAVAGDGGFGQYLAEFTTAVRYNMDITLVLLNNSQLGKISKEFEADDMEVWQTGLTNPDFAAYAKLCGGDGIRVSAPDEIDGALIKALASKKPFIVEFLTDPLLI